MSCEEGVQKLHRAEKGYTQARFIIKSTNKVIGQYLQKQVKKLNEFCKEQGGSVGSTKKRGRIYRIFYLPCLRSFITANVRTLRKERFF